jgi:hypothetical protein
MVEVEDTLLAEVEEAIDSKKIPVSIIIGQKVDKEYRRLACKLGTHYRAPLTLQELTSYLAKNSITVYPASAVKSYMQKRIDELPKPKGYSKWAWKWYALRFSDMRIKGDKMVRELYKKPVPVEVLMAAEKIADDLGSGVRFYVSDIAKNERPTQRDVDPFLAVSCDAVPRFIIERWNEPAFRS